MMNEHYLTRIFDKKVQAKLQIAGAVCIVGAKAVGKTKTAEHFTVSQIYLKENAAILKQVNLNNEIALNGEYPRLIDE
jgi:hypothetical protein